MRKETLFGKRIAICAVVVLLCLSLPPGVAGSATNVHQQNIIQETQTSDVKKVVPLTLYLFEKTGIKKHTTFVSADDVTEISQMFQELKNEMTKNVFSENAQKLQQKFFSLLEEKGIVPEEISKAELVSLLRTPDPLLLHPLGRILPFQGKASEWMCTFASQGTGSMLPIIILPRLIPFMLTPIPRVLIRWNVKDGFTTCGGLRSGTGFTANGEQKGVAVGFWGVGLTFSLPPVMNFYGLAGYALYATVTANQIDHYPPNNPPGITMTDPTDEQDMVPMSTSQLRFSIKDIDGDLMSYDVTTTPDIGSGSGGMKPDGIYSIPIHGLESLTQYTWHIQVSDGEDTTEKTVTFITEPVAPVISDPSPANGEREVSVTQSSLRFSLKDFQGDAMSYTVQTSPNIGSGSETNVHNGTYTVPVSGLTYGAAYQWFVNTTDGAPETHSMFNFSTGYPGMFNPFEYGFHYRKQVTIDHTKVTGDLTDFTVLLSTVDNDLRLKAQDDGGDILFMNGPGVSSRLYHEIETYDASSGTLLTWVKVPVLSSSNDTVLYMYYGNPTCADMQYPEKTWDLHYLAIWHLNDAHGAKDSTDNHDATAVVAPAYQTTGKIGYAQTYSGGQYLSIAHPSTMIGLGSISVEAWVKMNSDTTGSVLTDMHDATYSGEAWRFLYVKGDSFLFRLGHGNPGDEEADALATGISPGTWYYFAGTWIDGAKTTIYTNGILSAQSASTFTGMISRPDTDAFIGVEHPGSHSSFQNYLNGMADEIRVSDIARSPSWISTSYNTQNDPTGFLLIGPEESAP